MNGELSQQHDGGGVPFWTPGHPWLHETTGNNDRAWYSWVELLAQAGRKVYDGTKAELRALKGLWVKAGNKIVVSGRYVRIPNAGDHALDELARALGERIVLPVSEEELGVPKRLSAFVIFAGRYPIPLTPEKVAPMK